MTAFDGECFCGAIKYRVDGELIEPRCCHCSRCRKAFSGSGSVYAEVTADAFRWTAGEQLLQTYGDPQVWALAFCRVCGSTLAGLHGGRVHGITLGTLNGEPPIAIRQHLFVGSKAPWDEIGGPAPQFAERP